MQSSPLSLSDKVRAEARGRGFDLVGITRPDHTRHLPFYRGWLAEGHHGEMDYLARSDSVARRGDLRRTMAEVRSVVVVGVNYLTEDQDEKLNRASAGVIARYARGRDYHFVVEKKLVGLAARIQAITKRPLISRAYVDTGPILERDLARRAGMGWFGKNTMLIHPRRGSWFFLGALLLDLELEPDEPFSLDHCGSCTRCLDACPTGALLGRDEDGAPVMDSRRCISYLTIEQKGPIPLELRSAIGNRIFGCDICQECCPWNETFAKPSKEPDFLPREGLDGPALVDLAVLLLGLSEKAFSREFADSPVTRARRKGLLRNVCVALGNWGADEAVPTLVSALSDSAPLVRGHAAWALGRISSPAALEGLASRLIVEDEGWVRDEISSGLAS